jgi:hypothetical protein
VLRTTHFVPPGAKLLIDESNAEKEPVFDFATHEEVADARALLSKDKAVVAAAKRRIEARKRSCIDRRVAATCKSSIRSSTKEARESRQAACEKRRHRRFYSTSISDIFLHQRAYMGVYGASRLVFKLL